MPKDVKEQIEEMLSVGDSTVTSAPATESAATEAPGTESPGTEAPGTKIPETEAPSTDAPTTEAPADDELERIKKENDELRKKLSESTVKKAPKTKAPTTAAPFEEIDFLGKDIDLDDLTRDSSVFNKMLNKVYKMGVDASRKFQETTLRNIPEIVKSNVVIQATLKKKVNEFYDDNTDLKPFKKVVATVYEELASENPDWEMGKIFDETEKETRRRLELQKKAKTPGQGKEKHEKPKFPKTKSSRSGRQKPNTSPLLEDIDKMNDIL